MKDRLDGFLSEEHIDHGGEIFDYIRELHHYLWRVVRVVSPGSSGNLDDYVDGAIDELERDFFKPHNTEAIIDVSLLKDFIETEKRYHELIMAVESKYQGESRHDTALRYIHETEARESLGAEGE